MRHSGGPKVVVSGIGVVSPFGVGRERFWDHVRRGCSGTRAITEFDCLDCDANNPWPDGVSDGEELRCHYCGAEFMASIKGARKLKLRPM